MGGSVATGSPHEAAARQRWGVPWIFGGAKVPPTTPDDDRGRGRHCAARSGQLLENKQALQIAAWITAPIHQDPRGALAVRYLGFKYVSKTEVSGPDEWDIVRGSFEQLLTESARPDVIRRDPRAPWLAVAVVCFGAFMGQLDASVVTLTFRPIQHAFAAPLAGVQWVSLAYLLALVALLTPAGRIADTVGRKLVYSYGFVVFTLASAACGLAGSLGVLVAFRVVQAAGAAMLQANSVALVTTTVPRNKMRLALGVQAGAQAMGLALGPTIGGLLTATAGWRSVFWINVPVGCVAVLASRYLLPRTRQFRQAGRFDSLGTVLLATATTALLLALSGVGGLPIPAVATAGLAAAAIAAAAGFVTWQRRASDPLIPLQLLRSRALAASLSGALAGYLVLFGPLVLLPQVLAASPGDQIRVGLLLSALPLGFGLAALSADSVLPASWGNRRRGVMGGLGCTVAATGLIFAPLTPGWLVTLLAVIGLGLGVYMPANNAVIMRSGGVGSAAVLGGLVNVARGLGMSLGVALVALALHLGGTGAAGTLHPRLAITILAAASAALVIAALTGPADRPTLGSGLGRAGGRGEAAEPRVGWCRRA